MTDQELIDLVASLAIDSKELRISQKEASEELRISQKELRISQKEASEQQKKTDEQMRKTDKKLERIGKKLDKLGDLYANVSDNIGNATEEFFYNSIDSNPILKGIHYDFVNKNCRRHKGKIQGEFDIVCINGKDIAIIEVKTKAHVNDVEKIITTKSLNFELLYPEYKNYNHHYGLASFHVNEDVFKAAKKSGVMILQRKGDLIETT